ncbi:unnamed protein product [Penicillium salamii]|uniref:SET domain-containing protein n=1 Tax=Penicillium salamii TaxID=1612424 RepID=A0A9W4NXY1_9EURO|nr:unnamed protein product [Penicillium salamii]CAG8336565.1 unnamed protein product [Penicillium salamii]CAG8338282.1 unnamed protein product [Penicillium salamii]CAG8370966.1 unnamed protein product [Penicillium salamii]CAG8387107.1 unnamed protein product [Penicillium salamii]
MFAFALQTIKMAPQRNTTASKASKTSVDDFKPFNLEDLFPPYGSEAALMQTAQNYAKETLASIYFDLNAYSHFQREANPDDFYSMQVMDNLVNNTVSFMEKEFANYSGGVKKVQKEQGESQYLSPENRFYATITEIGWKMTAICAHTEAFRRAFREADHRLWGCLLQGIQTKSLSIEHYAHCRALDWISLIKNVTGPTPGLPSVQEAVASALKWDIDHPHHTVLTLDGGLKRAEFNGQLQTNIKESSYRECFHEDPTAKSDDTSSGGCILCGSEEVCGCILQSRAGELVELAEFPGVGTGVRTLTTFDRRDILDVYVGELRPEVDMDTVYPLSQSCDGSEANHLAYVCAHKSGNWTRFINHSCQPSTQFVVRTIGDRVVTTIEAIRYIGPFEELTIDYGADYWQTRECACGHWNCISNPSSPSGSPLPQTKVLSGKITKNKSSKGKKTTSKSKKVKGTKGAKGTKGKK